MFRPAPLSFPGPSSPPSSWGAALSRLLLPLCFWICVSLGLGYGRYSNYEVALGPSSSHLVKVNSIFVERVLVRENGKKGVLVHGFSTKPDLSLETNWSANKYLFVEGYDRKGISLWLNRGSTIKIAWEARPKEFHDVVVVLLKGGTNSEKLLWQFRGHQPLGLEHPNEGDGKFNYTVEDDDSYYIGATNLNAQRVLVTLRVDVSSKMYDTADAKTLCQRRDGFCEIQLPFPNAQYVLLTTPNDASTNPWVVELSFVARLVTYVIILGLLVIILSLAMKCLGVCNVNGGTEAEQEEEEEEITTADAETDPLISTKEVACLYGAVEEDEESGLRSSSQDLYDGKICVICYDEARNCFFVPCGHCATCYTCAQRIMDGENKACPICRRYIHRVRRLPSP